MPRASILRNALIHPSVALGLAALCTGAQAEALKVLGVDLGGKASVFKKCRVEQISDMKTMCFIEKRRTSDARVSRWHVQLPQSTVPRWMTYGEVTLEVDTASNQIDALSVYVKDPSSQNLMIDAIDSVSTRFGRVKAEAGSPTSPGYKGFWEAPGAVRISISGSPTIVQLTFASKRSQDRFAERDAGARAASQSQPKAP